MKKKINMMSEIAEKYGLELNKPFIIFREEEFNNKQYQSKTYHFTENGIVDQYGISGYESILKAILSGEYFVEKVSEFAKPIICKTGEQYQFVTSRGNVNRDYIFENTTIDYLLRKSGNMFSINDDIPQAQIDKIVSEMKGE